MAEVGLGCHDMSFQYPGDFPVFEALEADFPAGRASLITGDTGTGKSTLLHLLGGLLTPTAGRITAQGQSVSHWRSRHKDLWRRQVGILFQRLHLIDELSVLENAVVPLIPRRSSWSRCVNAASPLLERLDLRTLAHTPTGRLSGGQRQRVALVRALVHQPRFILLDEPSAFQDDRHTRLFITLLSERKAQGACVVVCSHDDRLLAAADTFDRRWVLASDRHPPQLRPQMMPTPGRTPRP